MKMKIINSLLVAASAILFTACDKTEGALYSGDTNKVSFLSATTSMNMEGGSLKIPVGRTSTAGELSVPVTLTASGEGYTNVFTVDGPLQFANGEGKSYVTVNYGDLSTIDPSSLPVASSGLDVNVGLAFPFTLSVAEENVSLSNIGSVTINASNALKFQDMGTVELNSEEGWQGEIFDVEIQKAEGANVYKVVSPFGANSFAFMIKSDGKTVVCPNQVIYNHSTYGAVSMSTVTGTVEDGVVTLNVGDYTVSAGSFGGGVEIIKLPE